MKQHLGDCWNNDRWDRPQLFYTWFVQLQTNKFQGLFEDFLRTITVLRSLQFLEGAGREFLLWLLPSLLA